MAKLLVAERGAEYGSAKDERQRPRLRTDWPLFRALQQLP